GCEGRANSRTRGVIYSRGCQLPRANGKAHLAVADSVSGFPHRNKWDHRVELSHRQKQPNTDCHFWFVTIREGCGPRYSTRSRLAMILAVVFADGARWRLLGELESRATLS